MPPSPARKEDIGPPGAGTLFVYGRNGPGQSRRDKNEENIDFEELGREDPVLVTSPDALLHRGIADYTFLPASGGGVLGKGKFSTVYKVTTTDGNIFALKHTPLHPHHPLISSRLLREPTLLAQLPPHPCLIGVDGWVRTGGHFYLIEQYATSHVALPLHPLPLSPTRAAYILDQLVSVVRDGLHNGGRVCHRDLKGENVLVDVETGDILLLDLGLATHYSASQPRLTTCCGSPAFHSPEIVNALNHPPGAVTYYGPELDIWCLALTMLALLLQTRFPLGPTHTSRYVMQERVRDRLQELDEVFPPNAPWRGRGHSRVSDHDQEVDRTEWRRVRKAMADFLEIDGIKRMASFAAYDVGDRVRSRVQAHGLAHKGRSFKTTSFVPAEVKYTLPVYVDEAESPTGKIKMRNPTGESEKRILSYIKYLLRSGGILYHCLPDSMSLKESGSNHFVLMQLVLPLAPSYSPSSSLEPIPAPIASTSRPRSGERDRKEIDSGPSFLSTIFSLGRKNATARASSVPPKPVVKATPPVSTKKGKEWATKCWIKVEFEGRRSSHGSSTNGELVTRKSKRACGSRASSRSRNEPAETALERLSSIIQNEIPHSIIEGNPDHRTIAQTLESLKVNGTSAPIRPHHQRTVSRGSSRLRQISDGTKPDIMLSPLSRQVSVERDRAAPKSRPPSQSRKSSYQTTHSRRHFSLPLIDTVIISSSEPRAYDLLRKAFDVKHVEAEFVSETTPDLESSKDGLVGLEVEAEAGASQSAKLRAEPDERPRGRSKEVARSHESEKRLSRHSEENPTQLEVKISDSHPPSIVKVTSQLSESGPGREEEGKKSRDSSRGRGFLEGWFGRGAQVEAVGQSEKSSRSSSMPPSILSHGLWVGNM